MSRLGVLENAGGAVYAPNLRIQLLGNVVVEGNHLWNWNATYPYPHPKVSAATCSCRPPPPPPPP
eukprot:SAG22_NODE_10703_length_520_cov_0.942993_1_plen_64_part_10